MKRLFLFFILLPTLCFAGNQQIINMMNLYSAASEECADSSCTGFLVCQNAEGAGYDNSESWSESGGTVDEDNTSSPLRGSQDIAITYSGDNGTTTMNFTGSEATVYGSFYYGPGDATPASNKTVLYLLNSSSTAIMQIIVDTSSHLGVTCNDGSFSTTTDTMADSTNYHVWYYYTTNGVDTSSCWVEFTAEGTRTPVGSGNKYTSDTGTETDDADKLYLIHNKNTACQYDQILLKTSEIGTICE